MNYLKLTFLVANMLVINAQCKYGTNSASMRTTWLLYFSSYGLILFLLKSYVVFSVSVHKFSFPGNAFVVLIFSAGMFLSLVS